MCCSTRHRSSSRPGETAGTSFRFDRIQTGTLSVWLDLQDDLAADNRASRPSIRDAVPQVMLVTSENEALEMGLGTETARKVADISIMQPAGLESSEFRRQAEEGGYDLVIFDRCRPDIMPAANTLFFGELRAPATPGRGKPPSSVRKSSMSNCHTRW